MHLRGNSGEVQDEALEVVQLHLLNAAARRECQDGAALRVSPTCNSTFTPLRNFKKCPAMTVATESFIS